MDYLIGIITSILIHWRDNPFDMVVEIFMSGVWTLVVTWLFWGLYVMGMGLQREMDTLKAQGKDFTFTQKTLAGPWVSLLVIVDVVFRFTYGILIFFPDLPRELTFSQQLERLLSYGKGSWRYKLAFWLASELINPFSAGAPHIRTPLE